MCSFWMRTDFLSKFEDWLRAHMCIKTSVNRIRRQRFSRFPLEVVCKMFHNTISWHWNVQELLRISRWCAVDFIYYRIHLVHWVWVLWVSSDSCFSLDKNLEICHFDGDMARMVKHRLISNTKNGWKVKTISSWKAFIQLWVSLKSALRSHHHLKIKQKRREKSEKCLKRKVFGFCFSNFRCRLRL